MAEHTKFVVRCRAIILHNGKMLVVKHPHNTSFAALPGGHLENGEDPKEGVAREITEELGVKPEIGRLLYVNTFRDGDKIQPVEFFFEVLNGEDYLNAEDLLRTHAHELAEILWVGPQDTVKILPAGLAEDFKNGTVLSNDVRFMNGIRK